MGVPDFSGLKYPLALGMGCFAGLVVSLPVAAASWFFGYSMNIAYVMFLLVVVVMTAYVLWQER
jgi:hypothetical protein